MAYLSDNDETCGVTVAKAWLPVESPRSWQWLRAPSTVVGAEQWSAPSSDSQRTRSEVIEACAVDANQRSQQPSSPFAAAA